MKLNWKYLLITFLVLVLLYCCLGNNLLEGLEGSGSEADPLHAAERQKSNEQEAKKGYTAYQDILWESGLGAHADPGTDPDHKSCRSDEKLKHNKCVPRCNSSTEHWSVDKKKCIHTLQPESTDPSKSCDTGYVWNKTVQKCEKKLVPLHSECDKNMHWDKHLNKCVHDSKHPSRKHDVGGDTDKHGCKGSAGEYWCEPLKTCIRPWEQKCPTHHKPPEQHKHPEHKHPEHHKHPVHKQPSHKSHEPPDHKGAHTGEPSSRHQERFDSYHHRLPGGISRSQLPIGQEDKYILKSEIIPPICPACPPVLACSGKTKCPPCPSPQPVEPCPPCGRCPEPSFECKKVPNYKSMNKEFLPHNLPRPWLNDFSQF